MAMLLPQVPRKPSFAEIIGSSLGQGIQSGSNQATDFAQKMALQKEQGQSFSNLQKQLEKQQKFKTGLETIQAMREIAAKKNIGRGSGILGFFPGETAKDRAEYEQLGKSLIPIVAAGVPIRNQKEFEEYKKTITNPSASLSEIEGALNGLETLFYNQLEESEEEEKLLKKSKNAKVKFNPQNKEHRAKRDQLLKTYKGDREKVAEILSREFEE